MTYEKKVIGTFNTPGRNSENAQNYGPGSVASGFSSMAIGFSSMALPSKSIAMGAGATVSGFSGICIGTGALNTDNGGNTDSVIMGNLASAWGGGTSSNVILGGKARSNGGNNVVIGSLAGAYSNQNIAIGLAAHTSGSYGMAFGANAFSNNAGSVVFNGRDSGPNQFVTGSPGNPIKAWFVGNGSTADHVFTSADTTSNNIQVNSFGNGQTFVGDKLTGPGLAPNTYITVINGGGSYTLNKAVTTPETAQQFQVILGSASISATGGYTGSNNDIGGTDLVVAGGSSVGTGIGGSVKLQTTFPGPTTSNSAVNTLIDRFLVNAYQVDLTSAATTNLFDIALPTLTGTGGCVDYTIFATDGTDVQILTGNVVFAAVNQAGTYTTAASPVTATSTLSGGTLTATWALTNVNADSVTLQVTPTTSLTTTKFNATYTITNNSPQAIIID